MIFQPSVGGGRGQRFVAFIHFVFCFPFLFRHSVSALKKSGKNVYFAFDKIKMLFLLFFSPRPRKKPKIGEGGGGGGGLPIYVCEMPLHLADILRQRCHIINNCTLSLLFFSSFHEQPKF